MVSIKLDQCLRSISYLKMRYWLILAHISKNSNKLDKIGNSSVKDKFHVISIDWNRDSNLTWLSPLMTLVISNGNKQFLNYLNKVLSQIETLHCIFEFYVENTLIRQSSFQVIPIHKDMQDSKEISCYLFLDICSMCKYNVYSFFIFYPLNSYGRVSRPMCHFIASLW
jgi:hypothetical protein